MPLPPRSLLPLALASAIALAACAGSPSASHKPTTGVPVATKASKQPTPSAMPSLGLLLEGKVTIEPGMLLDGKLAQPTATGVKIISDNGLGIISDNGLGLISDNGAGIVSNHAAGYSVTAAGAVAAAGALKPVEGMWVSAVSLFDGRVLAGPVATRADGGYRLGFYKTPERNMRIVAIVPKHEADAQYTYDTLVAPSPAPVLTSDTTRLVSDFVLDLLPALLQPVIELAKQDPLPTLPPDADPITQGLAAQLFKLGPTKLAEVDKDGAVAKGISERLVSYADLSNVAFKDLFDVCEEVRLFSETLPEGKKLPLSELRPFMRAGKDAELAAYFEDRGMATDKAADLAQRLLHKGHVVGELLSITLLAHQDDVFGPIAELAE